MHVNRRISFASGGEGGAIRIMVVYPEWLTTILRPLVGPLSQ